MRASRLPLPLRCVLVVLAALTLLAPAQAQRVALLVGNANYSVGRLTNPPNDVAAMEKALGALGFKVQKVLNANQNQMKRAVRDFGSAAQGAEVAFLYYSGHGTQANGENYLLPVGASIEKESDYEVEAVSANAVLAQIRGAQPKAAILVLDACRDNPLAAVTKSATKGLGRMSAPTGTMIAFATAPGDTASDNGHYARVLAKEIQKPGQELVDVFRNTAAEVRKLSASGKVQDPRISEMSINERLYLAGAGTQVASINPQLSNQALVIDPEQETWELAKKRDTLVAYKAYLKRYPQGRYADTARVAMDGLQPGAGAGVVPTATDPGTLPSRPSLSIALDESVWQAVEASEAYRNAPTERAFRSQRVERESTVFTGSAMRGIDSPPEDTMTWTQSRKPISERCVSATRERRSSQQNKTYGSDTASYSCAGLYLGSINEGKLQQRVAKLTTTGSLFPPRIGAEQVVQADLHFATDRKFDSRMTSRCQVTGRMDANQISNRLSGTAWLVKCQWETRLTGGHDGAPIVTETEDYLIENLGLRVSEMGILDYQQKRYVLPAPGFVNVMVTEGEYGSRTTGRVVSFDWSVAEPGVGQPAPTLAGR